MKVPSGDGTTLGIEPLEVEDAVPEEGKIEWAVKRLRNNRSGGPSWMRAEHIKGWLAAVRRAEKGETADTEKGDRAHKGGGRKLDEVRGPCPDSVQGR